MFLNVSRHVSVLPGPFELQGCKSGRKASYYTCHFPRAFSFHCRPLCAALCGPIVLGKAAGGIGSAANVIGFAILGAQEVTAVKGGHRPGLYADCLDHVHDDSVFWLMIQNKDENNKWPNQGKGKEADRCIVIGPMDSSRWSWSQPLADLKSRASAKAMYRYHCRRAPRAAKIVTKRKQETGGDQMAEMVRWTSSRLALCSKCRCRLVAILSVAATGSGYWVWYGSRSDDAARCAVVRSAG